MILHEGGQNVSIAVSALIAAKLLPNATVKNDLGFSRGILMANAEAPNADLPAFVIL